MSIYVCIDHNEKVLNKYFDCLNDIFYKISKKDDKEILRLIDKVVIDDLKK